MNLPRSNAAAHAALLVTSALSAAPAFALPVYDAGGFASPRFTANASLEGQDLVLGGPWQITSNLNPAQANVRPTVGVGGGQGVEVVAASGKTNTQWYVSKSVLPVTPLDTVTVDWAMNYAQTTVAGLQFGPFFGVELYDASSGTPKQIGGFGVDSTTGELLALIDNGTAVQYDTLLSGATVAAGSYNNYGLSVDFTAKTYTLLLNGVPLEVDPFIDSTATAFTDAPITTRFVSNPSELNLNAGTAYFDNYAINVVPEPTMMTGIAMFALGLARRRR